MNTKEGFSLVTIPAQTYKSCRGCKYYESNLWKSGQNPEYSHNCNNPDIEEFHKHISFHGNLPDEDHTPSWCPFVIQEEELRKKINK